jgi:hypothetical protein
MQITKPTRGLDNPKFKYVPACKTDLSKTFAKARRLINLQRAAEAAKQGKE